VTPIASPIERGKRVSSAPLSTRAKKSVTDGADDAKRNFWTVQDAVGHGGESIRNETPHGKIRQAQCPRDDGNDKLIVAVDRPADELRVLRNVLDELRQTRTWAVRNGQFKNAVDRGTIVISPAALEDVAVESARETIERTIRGEGQTRRIAADRGGFAHFGWHCECLRPVWHAPRSMTNRKPNDRSG